MGASQTSIETTRTMRSRAGWITVVVTAPRAGATERPGTGTGTGTGQGGAGDAYSASADTSALVSARS